MLLVEQDMFKNALVKTPSQSMVAGITHAGLGLPDHNLALEQHKQYIGALAQCGLQVEVLPAEDSFPDACFVEDPAIITPAGAIITHPGATSRQGETLAIAAALETRFTPLAKIEAPGTLDGGDVMMVGNHYYIGLSARTNQAGAEQLIAWLEQQQLTGSVISLQDVLHLKTGVSYLENGVLLVSGEFIDKPEFRSFRRLEVPPSEVYAANCIWVNDRVIMPAGFPVTQGLLQSAGFEVLAVDVSEFQKLDGGVSCLSLRF